MPDSVWDHRLFVSGAGEFNPLIRLHVPFDFREVTRFSISIGGFDTRRGYHGPFSLGRVAGLSSRQSGFDTRTGHEATRRELVWS